MAEPAAAGRASSRAADWRQAPRVRYHLPYGGSGRRPVTGEAASGGRAGSIEDRISNFDRALKGVFDLWLDERLPSLKEDVYRRHAADTIDKVRILVSRLSFPEQILRIMARTEDGGLVDILVVHKCKSPGQAVEAVRRDFRAVDPAVPGAHFEFAYVKHRRFEEADFDGFVDVLARRQSTLGTRKRASTTRTSI